MTSPELFVSTLAVIACFSVVQSLFGVGLLVFGTPMLLLLGVPFDAVLASLLPASLAISTIQAIQGRSHIGNLRCVLPAITIPCIGLGLYISLSGVLAVDLKVVVGMALLATAIMRFSSTAQEWLASILKRNLHVYLAAMGLVHGVSNMGGGLLAVLCATVYREKRTIRSNIAYSYLIFGSTQLAVLAALRPEVFGLHQLVFASLAVIVYLTVGNRVFGFIEPNRYAGLFTFLNLAYGAVLLAQPLFT